MGKWTIRKVEELYEVVKQGSVGKIKGFLDLNGLESFPKKKDDGVYQGHFDPGALWVSCVVAHDVDTYKYLTSLRAITKKRAWYDNWRDPWPALLRSVGTNLASSDADSIKEFVRAIIADGYKRKSRSPGLNMILYTVLPEDIGFCEAVRDSGIDISTTKYDDKLWESLLVQNRQSTMDFIVESGFEILCESNRLIIPPGTSVAAIDHALLLGLPIEYVDADCDRDCLLAAAQRGIRPAFVEGEDPLGIQRLEQDIGAQGMERVFASGDIEVLEAFLDIGVTSGVSVQKARVAGREDIAEILVSRGFSEVERVVTDGVLYSDPESDVVIVPEGVERIEEDAFYNVSATSIILPSTLVAIGDRGLAMIGAHKRRITIPKSVTELGYGACKGFEEITVYDTINPDAHLKLDSCNGTTDATVGWLGISPKKGYMLATNNAYPSDFEVIVRSAETDEIKYKVWMPCVSSSGSFRNTYSSSWGPNASFAFANVDPLFDKMPNKKGKLKTTINRLRWPYELDEEFKSKLESYALKNAKDMIKLLADDDDIEGVEFFAEMGLLTKRNIDDMRLYASEGGRAPKVAEYLEKRRSELLGDAPVTKPKKKLTVSQVVKLTLQDLRKESLDASRLDELEGRSLKSVRPNAVVDLYEAAALLSDPAIIKRLFSVFGKAEFESGALAVAINTGNTETALTLCEHGANLACRLNEVEFSGDTTAKMLRRREEYLERDVYGRALSKAGAADETWNVRVRGTISELNKAGYLSATDLKALCLVAANEGNAELAFWLIDLGADDEAEGYITIWRYRPGHYAEKVKVYKFEDLLYPDCHPGTARFVCQVRPQAPSRVWTKAYLKGKIDTIKELIPCLSESTYEGSKVALVRLLAENGCLEELKTISNWKGFFTKSNLDCAIDLTNKAGNVEATAYLLDERNRRFPNDTNAVGKLAL